MGARLSMKDLLDEARAAGLPSPSPPAEKLAADRVFEATARI